MNQHNCVRDTPDNTPERTNWVDFIDRLLNENFESMTRCTRKTTVWGSLDRRIAAAEQDGEPNSNGRALHPEHETS